MASVKKTIEVRLTASRVWDIVRDIGALHTKLVPGFVTDTQVDGRARIVTFANGMVVREPIVDLDDAEMRLVWGAEGAGLDHYNGAVQIVPTDSGSRITWRSDFLPDERAPDVAAMIEAGMRAMQSSLDALATHDASTDPGT